MANKILIIDDDLFIRELYDEVLKNGGFEVDLAENGEQGLSKLQNGGYALILLDMNMEPIDGLQVLKKLSEYEVKNKNGPILLLTNMSTDSKTQEGIQNGATGYLMKADLTPDQLVNKINEYLSRT
jgi:DNA-binding response OmpR family regulator